LAAVRVGRAGEGLSGQRSPINIFREKNEINLAFVTVTWRIAPGNDADDTRNTALSSRNKTLRQ
jgi:hypothetical protein